MARGLITVPHDNVFAFIDWPGYMYDRSPLFDEVPNVDSNGNLLNTPQPQTALDPPYRSYDKYITDNGLYPLIFDFRESTIIEKIYYFDYTGSRTMKVERSDDGINWVFISDVIHDRYNVWRQYDVPIEHQTMRYIRVSMTAHYWTRALAFWGETVVGGLPTFTKPPLQQGPDRPTIGDMMGICSFLDVPISIENVAERVRQYFNLRWCAVNEFEDPRTRVVDLKWNDVKWIFTGYSLGNMDIHMRDRFEAGIKTTLCIMKGLTFLKSQVRGAEIETEGKPVDDGYDHETQANDPNAYRTYAHGVFNVVARYGNTVVDTNLLSLHPTETVVATGLGYFNEVELWNEQNADWNGRIGYFRPEEYAAFLSACIDGHNGTMLDDNEVCVFGAKAADPTIKIYLGGYSDSLMNHFMQVIKYMAQMRSQTEAEVLSLFDQIDFHAYISNGQGQIGRPGTVGRPPEGTNTNDVVADWRNRYSPNALFQNGEIGYDAYWSSTGRRSKIAAPKIINNNSEETKGAWIVRLNYLAIKQGIERTKQYMIRDVSNSAYTFQSAGLVATKATYFKKEPYWIFSMHRKNLNDHKVEQWLSAETETTGLHIFQSRNQLNTNEIAYVLWIGLNPYPYYADENEALNDAANIATGHLVLVESNVTDTRNGYYERTSNTSPTIFSEAYTLYMGRTISNYELTIDSSITRARILEWAWNMELGASKFLPITNEKVIINITDQPIIIIGDNKPATVPTSPYDLEITSATGSSISFIWKTDAKFGITTHIERSIDGVNFIEVTAVDITTIKYTDSNLNEDTLYYYRLRSSNDIGYSNYSNIQKIKTGIKNVIYVQKAQIDFRRELVNDNYELPPFNWNIFRFRESTTLNLINENNQSTNIVFELYEDANTGWSGVDVKGIPNSTLLSRPVYAMLLRSYGPTYRGGIKFSNLDDTKLYTIKLASVAMWAKEAKPLYIYINNNKKIFYDAKHAVNKLAILSTIRPTNGQIIVYVEPIRGNNYYTLAAVIIEEYDDAGTSPSTKANAGDDILVDSIVSSVELDGFSSYSTHGYISTWGWSQISGSAVTINNSNSPNPTVTGLQEGDYTFQLTITDSLNNTDTDTILVQVRNNNPRKYLGNSLRRRIFEDDM